MARTVSRTASKAAGVDGREGVGVGAEQLADQGPQGVEGGLGLGVRHGGAVAEADHPAGGVVAVVGELVDALGGDRREHRVGGGGQLLEQGQPPGGEDQQADDELGEVTVVVLGQADAPELLLLAEEGELVLGLAGDPARPGQQQARLAEEVEGDVGDRGLLFELGEAGHPLLEAVAVDQRVVAEGEAPAGERVRVELLGHGRVDAGQGVGEAGAERPAVALVVVLREEVVRVVVGAVVSVGRWEWGGGGVMVSVLGSVGFMGRSDVGDVVGDVVEGGVAVHLVAGRLEERVLLVRA